MIYIWNFDFFYYIQLKYNLYMNEKKSIMSNEIENSVRVAFFWIVCIAVCSLLYLSLMSMAFENSKNIDIANSIYIGHFLFYYFIGNCYCNNGLLR